MEGRRNVLRHLRRLHGDHEDYRWLEQQARGPGRVVALQQPRSRRSEQDRVSRRRRTPARRRPQPLRHQPLCRNGPVSLVDRRALSGWDRCNVADHVGADRTLDCAEQWNNLVRKVGPDGILRTVAGTGTAAFGGDRGSALQAALNAPRGVAVGPDGAVYIADTCNNKIRRVTTDGIIDTVAGWGPETCTIYYGNYWGDGGLATSAGLYLPQSMAVADGAVFVADYMNARVRRFAVGGNIDTIAGNPQGRCGAPDCPATQYSMGRPEALALGVRGDLYATDNATIARISPSIETRLCPYSNCNQPRPDADQRALL